MMNRRYGTAAMLVIAALGPCGVRAEVAPPAHGFEALWAHARQHSPYLVAVRRADAQRAALRARARGRLADNPTLEVQAGPRLQAGYRNYDLSVGLSQPVRMGREPNAERALATKAEARLAAELDDVSWQLRQALRAACREADGARARVALTGELLAAEERVRKLIERRVAAGEGAPLDLRLADIAVLTARQEQLAAEQALTAARLGVRRLGGYPPSASFEPPALPMLPTLPSRSELVRAARARSTRVQLMAARAHESTAEVAERDRARAPAPALGFAYVRQGTTPASDPVSHTLFGTLSVPVPLWARNQPERARARADEAEAEAALSAEQQLIEAEVGALYEEVAALSARLALYDTSLLPTFEEHLQAIERALALGELSLLDFSAARARLLAVRRDALAVREALARALGALEARVGVELTRSEEGTP